MIRLSKCLGIAAIALALGWAALASVRSIQETATRSAPISSAAPKSAPRGASRLASAGCSASRCHGAEIPDDADKRPNDTWRWSSTVWNMSDVHRQAYDVLKDKRSKAICDLLDKDKEEKDRKAPWETTRCLVCHSDPAISHLPPDPIVVQMRSDGVGCRACHGDPGKWLEAHLSWGPKDDRKTVYEKVGMTWMNDLPSRAQVCVGCHVGAPPKGDMIARDVDHDLIAAGHPRLNFDFATYQRMMPPHWSEKKSKANFTVEAWSAGRLAEMVAALDLLSYRSDAAQSHPWPEFSEFNCYDCHHDLRDGDQSREVRGPKTPGEKPGRFNWYRAGELKLLGSGGESTADFLKAMQTPAPDQARVHELIPKVKDSLKPPPATPAELLKWIAAEEAVYPFPNWDQAGWAYQALVAIEIDRRNQGKSDALDPEFTRLRDKLRLSAPDVSPRWNSPQSYDPTASRELLMKLTEQLK
jgi:hypothetical protein